MRPPAGGFFALQPNRIYIEETALQMLYGVKNEPKRKQEASFADNSPVGGGSAGLTLQTF
ncbi:hypothetical protein VE23_11215 [Paenibacillus sp. D9]|nr:hypothetical protein VE23_11215 [Paenibacillus sp. D9]CDN44595.1 hypothetical protein BN871_FC_00120 [Paenibacillus sp. P22]